MLTLKQRVARSVGAVLGTGVIALPRLAACLNASTPAQPPDCHS